MRSSWKSLVAAAVGLVALPQFAAADEVQEQLQQMQERMSQLEEKLAATTDQLEDSKRKVDEQQKTIERVGLEDRSAASGIASFFESVEFGGWVSASYWWNTNEPVDGANLVAPGVGLAGGGPNTGTFGTANTFNPDHNTFQLDQLWFEMAKPATAESRGGFGADIVMGKTADLLTGSSMQYLTSGLGVPNVQSNGNDVAVFQAYAEYLAPLGPGLNIRAGRYATHIGAEVPQTTHNFNISRSLVWSILQPVNDVGVWSSMELENGFVLGAGVVNSTYSNLNTDFDNDKSYQYKLGFSQEGWGIAYNGQYGRVGVSPAAGGSSAKVGINNVVLTWDPSENLATWVDITHVWLNDGSGAAGNANPWTGVGGNPWAAGIALAGRLAITEATGFGVRGEYLYGNRNFFVTPANGAVTGIGDQQLWSITGTLDHHLTEALMMRGEVRYEQGLQNAGSDRAFYFKGGGSGVQKSQILLGADMVYSF